MFGVRGANLISHLLCSFFLIGTSLCDGTNRQDAINAYLQQEISQLRNVIGEMRDEFNKALQEHQSKSYVPRTCLELMSSDPTLVDGEYYIDPDGVNAGDAPIMVRCSKSGETSVLHDTMDQTNVGHCYDPGCYSRAVSYNASMRQMRALIELSPTCQQFIRYDCLSAVLAFEGIQYGWWNDRNGGEQYYWSGSNDTVHTCSCGVNESCVEPNNVKCNCDAVAPVALFDEGYITNKAHLPMTRLNFGRTSPSYSSGEHTLGALQCRGSHQSSAKKPGSCSDIWRSGNVVSGIYLVQPLENNTVLTVFCDMTKLPEEDGHQTLIGTADVKSQLVYFSAGRISNLQNYTGIVKYDYVNINIGNALDNDTGKFTVPIKGIYLISFDCLSLTMQTAVYVKLNGVVISNGFTQTAAYESTGNRLILPLEVGDVVYVELRYGGFFGTQTDRYTSFTGYLLLEL